MKKTFFILSLCASSVYAQNLSDQQNIINCMDNYNLRENFKGFIYSSDKNKKNRLQIQSFPNEINAKTFSGIWLEITEGGKISSVGPVYSDAMNDKGLILWAYEKYFSDSITLDSLWQINRTIHLKNISDESLLSTILLTIKNTPHANKLNSEKLSVGDRLWKVANSIAENRQDMRFKEVKNIEVPQLMELLSTVPK
jgi:hypothetical protein